MRKCPFHGCSRQLPYDYFACAAHWRTLGPADQGRIYDAYYKYRTDKIDLAELRRIQQEVLGDRGNANG